MSKKIGRLTLFLIPIGVAVNLVGFQLCAIMLKLPLSMDSLGTIVVGTLCGPWAGAIVGFLSNLVNCVTDPTSIFFAPLNIAFGVIAGFMGIRTEQNLPADQDEDTTPPADGEDGQTGDNTGEDTQSPEGEGTGGPLALDQTAITIAAGDTALLKVTGGTGEVTWSSSNDNIATVAGGSITGKAGGTATITATAGEESVSCTVTVTGDPWVSDADLSLNKTDFTLYSGNPDVQMKVKGTDSPVVWASENPNVASISDTGVVKWVGKGTTNITATVDGQVLTCIVRCR